MGNGILKNENFIKGHLKQNLKQKVVTAYFLQILVIFSLRFSVFQNEIILHFCAKTSL